ncbi:hypothetical protein Pla175_02240 [Pirellulimonas nuda]|uniref:Uncharacterized protein n=1 Tax=Pirellulimonas nuda TaxID=2528009 RepID=A0A518D5W4_9BACT|nr:hypothetical protein [Pirellulimonas nuda]QDU86871.1 hypothetical protein Pla175_02240 [Pirellulimonas nuda]
MKRLLVLIAFAAAQITAALSAAPLWGATVSVELISDRGMQSTAAQQWLQLLSDAGAVNVRLRGGRPGDEPRIEDLSGRGAEIYKLTGVLTSRDELIFPGAKFGLRDRQKLRDYFADLKADGAAAITAPKGMFGLTEPQFKSVFDDLSTPLTIDTEGRPLEEVLSDAAARLRLRLSVEPRAAGVLRSAGPVQGDFGPLSAGAALAGMLRGAGLALRPDKPRGEEVQHLVFVAGEAARKDSDGAWPVGWPVETSPREAAPILFEFLNVEVDGFKLAEAMGAITPRLGMPVLWDTRALAEKKIDPATTPVQLARTRTYYKRLLDKLLFQARLKANLRVDEVGKAFLYISTSGAKL